MELKEELGLDLHAGQLLCLDWVEPHGPWDGSLMLIFDGGSLREDQIADLNLSTSELQAYEFCTSGRGPAPAVRGTTYGWNLHALEAKCAVAAKWPACFRDKYIVMSGD